MSKRIDITDKIFNDIYVLEREGCLKFLIGDFKSIRKYPINSIVL